MKLLFNFDDNLVDDHKRVKQALHAAEIYIRIVAKTELGKNKVLRKYEDSFFKQLLADGEF